MCRLLERHGWQLKRIKGSHYIYSKPGQLNIITVPVHTNTTLKLGLELRIRKLAGI